MRLFRNNGKLSIVVCSFITAFLLLGSGCEGLVEKTSKVKLKSNSDSNSASSSSAVDIPSVVSPATGISLDRLELTPINHSGPIEVRQKFQATAIFSDKTIA